MSYKLPEINIVTVVHHDLRFLKDYVYGLKNLDYPPELLKVIFVDNASKDTPIDYIKENKDNLNIEFIRNLKNFGIAKANNMGIKRCTAPYICLLNPDTCVDKFFLINLVKKMVSDNAIGICEARQSPAELTKYFDPKTLVTPWSSTGGCLIRFEAIRQIGYFDEIFFIYWDDADLSFRMWLNGYKCVYVPEATFVHYAAHIDKNPQRVKTKDRMFYYSYRNGIFMRYIYGTASQLIGYFVYLIRRAIGSCIRGEFKMSGIILKAIFIHFLFIPKLIWRRYKLLRLNPNHLAWLRKHLNTKEMG